MFIILATNIKQIVKISKCDNCSPFRLFPGWQIDDRLPARKFQNISYGSYYLAV